MTDTGRPGRTDASIETVAQALRSGDRRTLARAITLVESTRSDDRMRAVQLLDALAEARDPGRAPAYRIGISGSPGVGKSTFIEAFGLHLTRDLGLRLAVLAVDPSSRRTGGSILGDKTRMSELSREPNAYIRPSASGGALGGVARRTREVTALCDAAGFDVVLIETVGVGQSEVAVADMTDAFVLLVAPAAGDELQGVKRGIMELADLVVVNKCDGDLEPSARATLADYASALRLLRPRTHAWTAEAHAVSARTGLGIADVWTALCRYRDALDTAGELAARQAEQRRSWLWEELNQRVVEGFRRDPSVMAALARVEPSVADGRRSPSSGADEVWAEWQQSWVRHQG